MSYTCECDTVRRIPMMHSQTHGYSWHGSLIISLDLSIGGGGGGRGGGYNDGGGYGGGGGGYGGGE